MRRAGKSVRRGFTIIEVIVIVVILGILAAVIAPRLLGRVGESKKAVAKTNAASLMTAMQLYANDCGIPEPGTPITVLFQRPSNVEAAAWKGPYVNKEADLKDPWGNEYVLVVPGNVNVDFDIISYGKDGQPGGEDENEDIGPGK